LKDFMVFISCLLQEERMQKCDTDLSDSSSVINSHKTVTWKFQCLHFLMYIMIIGQKKRWFCSLLQYKFGKISQVHSTTCNLIGLRCFNFQKCRPKSIMDRPSMKIYQSTQNSL
jgi:hypothetical protein